jgi:hypothetical protein
VSGRLVAARATESERRSAALFFGKAVRHLPPARGYLDHY